MSDLNTASPFLPLPDGIVIVSVRPTATELVVHIFGALAEFERDIIRERTNAGLQAARARGRKGGRPKTLTGKKVAMAQELYENKDNSIDEICKSLNISRATLYRYIKTK